MRTYLIVENDIRNAFLSNSRNTVKHLQDSGNNTCAAYDANGYLVSYAEKDNNTGKPYRAYFEKESSQEMAELYKKLKNQ